MLKNYDLLPDSTSTFHIPGQGSAVAPSGSAVAPFQSPDMKYGTVSHSSNDKKLSYRLKTGRQQSISFVAKLLSIAVMTYSYFYHLRNLRSANLLRTQ